MRPTGSIRKRSDGSFEICCTMGTDPLTGKRKRIYKTVSGKYDDAKKELRRVLGSLDIGDYIEPTKIKVSEFLTQWLETIHSQISPKTHERYSDIVNHFLIPAFGNCLLTKLLPVAIQNAYNKWENSGRRDSKEGGLAPRTRLHIHRITIVV